MQLLYIETNYAVGDICHQVSCGCFDHPYYVNCERHYITPVFAAANRAVLFLHQHFASCIEDPCIEGESTAINALASTDMDKISTSLLDVCQRPAGDIECANFN